MNPLQTVAQVSVEHIANVLPEGILVAVFAWVLLRVLRKQNSGTRFAVWFLALLTVALLPVLAAFNGGRALGAGVVSSFTTLRPAITIPGHWALVVFLLWMLGVSVSLMRLVAGLWRLRQLRRSCRPIVECDLDPAVRITLEAIRAKKSAASKATVATSECVRVPSAIGFWKRTIILPAWTLRELPASDLNAILLHEFAHLRRGDDWTNLIQKIVRALFFFHPAVWWIEKQLSVEREMACDDAVLAETANPHGYANCLVSLLEKSLAHRLTDNRLSLVHAAVNRAREASQRLSQILDKNRPAATRVWKPAVGMISGFAVICLMALPLAPQFIAFDRGAVTSSTPADSIASSRASLQSSLRSPAVIPAVFHMSESAVAPATKIAHVRATVPHKIAAPVSVASRLTKDDDAKLIEANASADPKAQPQYQTLVFIEATEYGSPDAPIWNVQVWHVTFIRAVLERTARIPVANSI
jgi:beta-lactamase regulating signal transducer with metallopeptidase domain